MNNKKRIFYDFTYIYYEGLENLDFEFFIISRDLGEFGCCLILSIRSLKLLRVLVMCLRT